MPTQDPLAPTPEFEARLRRGRELADRGEFHAAEGVFRTLVTEARERRPGNHVRALSTLTTLYGRAGRYLEVRSQVKSPQLAVTCSPSWVHQSREEPAAGTLLDSRAGLSERCGM